MITRFDPRKIKMFTSLSLSTEVERSSKRKTKVEDILDRMASKKKQKAIKLLRTQTCPTRKNIKYVQTEQNTFISLFVGTASQNFLFSNLPL